jgi:hypothetical protein
MKERSRALKGGWILTIVEKTFWIGLLIVIHFFVLITFQREVFLSALDGADRKASSIGLSKSIPTIAFHWTAAPTDRQ